MNALTIGKLARATGCTPTTIRYYERIGLLSAPGRTRGNTRVYHDRHLSTLGFIRHCRELGFDQASIRELLDLTGRPDRSCESVTAVTRRHLEDVKRKIARLESLRNELEHMIDACDGGRIADCRLVEALSDHGHGHCLEGGHARVDA